MRPIHPRAVAAVAAGILVLAAVPAAAQITFPPTPVGGETGFDCVFACIVNMEGASCSGPANQGGIIDTLSTQIPFHVENFRRGNAPSSTTDPCANGNTNPVTLPVNLNAGQVLYFDLFFRPTAPGNYDATLQFTGHKGSDTFNASVPLEGTATGGNPTAPCIDGPNTLCLRNDRFKVQTSWRTDQGTSGLGGVVPFQTTDSGLFWFFNSNNWEAVIKVLNGCPVNNRFWVFSGGLTNVETVITVTDTQTGDVKQYMNPLNTPFQPIQDTNAFATCP